MKTEVNRFQTRFRARAVALMTAVFLLTTPLMAPLMAMAAGLPLAEMQGTPPAPDFTLPDLDGARHTLSAYRGKVVIVNFWATWCPPCRKEIPSMQRAWEKLEDQGVVMLAVHVGGDVEQVSQFAFDYDARFPILMDEDSAVINAWPVRGLPTTIIVDKKGNMALFAIGGRTWDDAHILKRILDLVSP